MEHICFIIIIIIIIIIINIIIINIIILFIIIFIIIIIILTALCHKYINYGSDYKYVNNLTFKYLETEYWIYNYIKVFNRILYKLHIIVLRLRLCTIVGEMTQVTSNGTLSKCNFESHH